MIETNYFQILSLFWAAIGIGSRILMITFGERWNEWELKNAYRKVKPKWIYVVGISGLMLIGYTWYSVIFYSVDYSWIIASLVSLTAIKIFFLLFKYDKFRAFAKETLNNKKNSALLNGGVAAFSIVCAAMAFLLY